MARCAVLMGVAWLLAPAYSAHLGFSQSPSTSAPIPLEVSSVRPSAPNAPPGGVAVRGAEVRGTATTASQLVNFAYNLMPERRRGRVEGGPAWMSTERFDTAAKALQLLT